MTANKMPEMPQGGGEAKSPYGYCPTCGAKGSMRERRPNGDDICANNHKYPSRDALATPPAQQPRLSAEIINALPEEVRSYIMWLETDADPAGTLGRNWHLTRENAALRKLMEQAAHQPGEVGEEMVERIVANVKKWMGPVGQDIGVAHTATLRGTITDTIHTTALAPKGKGNG